MEAAVSHVGCPRASVCLEMRAAAAATLPGKALSAQQGYLPVVVDAVAAPLEVRARFAQTVPGSRANVLLDHHPPERLCEVVMDCKPRLLQLFDLHLNLGHSQGVEQRVRRLALH